MGLWGFIYVRTQSDWVIWANQIVRSSRLGRGILGPLYNGLLFSTLCFWYNQSLVPGQAHGTRILRDPLPVGDRSGSTTIMRRH